MDSVAEQIYAGQQQLIIAYAAAVLLWSKSFADGNYATAAATISTVAQIVNIDPATLNGLNVFLSSADNATPSNVGSTLNNLSDALKLDNSNLITSMNPDPMDIPTWTVGRPCTPGMAYTLMSAVGEAMPPGVQLRLNNLAKSIAD